MTIHPFHARKDLHRSATTWQMLLDTANDEQDVVSIARDFLASFTPHEIELLPHGCRPAKLVDGSDVATYAYDLALHRADPEDEGTPVVQAFSVFFADAAERLAQLARRAENDERESA